MAIKTDSIQTLLVKIHDQNASNCVSPDIFWECLDAILNCRPQNLSDCALLLDLVREVGSRWPELAEEVRGVVSEFVRSSARRDEAAGRHVPLQPIPTEANAWGATGYGRQGGAMLPV